MTIDYHFSFSVFNQGVCPHCEKQTLSVDQATDKSVRIFCTSCKRFWFYRYVATIGQYEDKKSDTSFFDKVL